MADIDHNKAFNKQIARHGHAARGKKFNQDGSLINIRQEMWCQTWVQTFDAKKSFEMANYNGEAYGMIRDQNLRKKHIQYRIKHILAERVAGLHINEDWIVLHLVKVLNQSIAGTQVMDREGNPTGEWTHDSRGALKALEMLGANIGMFQKQESRREVQLNLHFGNKLPEKEITVDLETEIVEEHNVIEHKIEAEPMNLE